MVLVHGIGAFPGLGLVGSAWANVLGQCIGAGLFLGALVRESRGSWRPRPAALRAQLAMGRDLVARSLAFQACFLSAAAVATRFGAPASPPPTRSCCSSGRSWRSCSTPSRSRRSRWSVRRSARGRGRRARALAARVTRYGLVLGIGFGVLFAALSGVLPPVFTPDAAVLAAVPVAWWFFAALQPVAGVVFAIDGVLLGAGDAAFLRTWTLLAARRRVPAADLGVAGVRMGAGRDLVGAGGVHAGAPRGRRAAGCGAGAGPSTGVAN